MEIDYSIIHLITWGISLSAGIFIGNPNYNNLKTTFKFCKL